MRKILNAMVCFFTIGSMATLQSCDSFGRNAKRAWEAGPIENWSHGGTFKGYVVVYSIDWIGGIQTRSSDTYRIYERQWGVYDRL